MAATDVDLEPQLKDVGKQLSHPLDSNDELLLVLDKLEKLLLKVDQSPKKSMLEALRPSINALIRDSLLKHSDKDVKVSVASCISEITRITAPDAPYTDDQMRDVFQLIVSSFEDLADRSSRSYSKRVSILETVSKVRSCVIMLDLECDELIVKMFEHFLNSVRDYHLDAIYSSMENIMVLVIEESEEISVDLLKPLLASVKKDRVGVLPIAHKLGKDVLLKSADKLKPYLMPALTALGEPLDKYHKVVAAVCEGTAANFDDNDAEANEGKLEKDSVDEAQQADESKVTTAASDHVDEVVKAEVSPKEEVDSTAENKSPKSVMSNGVNETVKEPKAEEASVDQESTKPEEDKSQEPVKKEDTADSDPDKLAKEAVKTEKEADTVMSSVEPSESSHAEDDKEVKNENDVKESETENEKEKESDDDDVKREDQNEKDDVKDSEGKNEKDDVKDSEGKSEKDDVKESENQNEEDKDVNDVKVSENKIEEEEDVKETENEAVESKPAAIAQSNNAPDESSVQSKKEPAPQEVKTASPSKSEPADEGLTQEDTPEDQKQEDKKTVVEKEVKLADTVNKSEDDEASDSDAKPLKRPRSKATKQSGKRSKQSGKKLETPVKKEEKGKIAVEEDEEDGSDDKLLKLSARKSTSKKKDDGKKRANSKNVAEKEQAKSLSEDDEMDVSPKIAVEEDDSDDKPLKQSGKRSKQSGKKLETPVKKGEKSKIEDDEDDSDDKPLKQSAKRSTSRKKNDGKQRKDQAKSLSGDDEMDISPKSDKREGKSTETPVTSAKRKRSATKTEASDTIKYDESLIGKKVKVWWPEDKMYYEGVVSEFFPAKKKHKVSYVDGDEEKLNLRTQKWEILKEFSARDDEEQNTEAQSDEGSPEIHKKKKTKSDHAVSQEKIKESAKKSNSKTKTGNKSNVKTPTTGSKSNGPTKAKSDVKEPVDAKGGSKSGNKRKKRT